MCAQTIDPFVSFVKPAERHEIQCGRALGLHLLLARPDPWPSAMPHTTISSLTRPQSILWPGDTAGMRAERRDLYRGPTMMPVLEQVRGGYAKYTAAHGAADVDSALVLNTTDYLDLLAVACDAVGAMAEARVYLDPAMASRALRQPHELLDG